MAAEMSTWIVETFGRASSSSAVQRWNELPLFGGDEVERVWSLRSVQEAGGITLTSRMALDASSEEDACTRAREFVHVATEAAVHVAGCSAERAPRDWRELKTAADLRAVEVVAAGPVGERDIVFEWEMGGDVVRVAVDEDADSVRIGVWSGTGTRRNEANEGWAGVWPTLARVRLREPVGSRRLIDAHLDRPIEPASPSRNLAGVAARPASRHDVFRL